MTCQNCRGHGYWIDVADGRKYPCDQCSDTERLYTAMRDLLNILQFLERGGTAWGLTPNEKAALNTIRELLPKTTE